MSALNWIRTELVARSIPFEQREHKEAFTAQDVAHEEHFSGNRVAKVVLVFADGKPIELIVPASRRVDLDKTRSALAAREVRLASEQELAVVFTDCEVGATPALRHWQGVRVVADVALEKGGDILFQAGTHTDAIRLLCRDWFDLVKPEVAAICAA